jgi:L-rhamnose mutarotase
MSRYCFLLHVQPERIAEYRARHREVWPEMLRALRHAGWRNYSLFLRPDGLLVGYVESDDLVAAQAACRTTCGRSVVTPPGGWSAVPTRPGRRARA